MANCRAIFKQIIIIILRIIDWEVYREEGILKGWPLLVTSEVMLFLH